MSNPSFPTSKSQKLALEYAKLAYYPNMSAKEFAKAYQNAYNEIHYAFNNESERNEQGYIVVK